MLSVLSFIILNIINYVINIITNNLVSLYYYFYYHDCLFFGLVEKRFFCSTCKYTYSRTRSSVVNTLQSSELLVTVLSEQRAESKAESRQRRRRAESREHKEWNMEHNTNKKEWSLKQMIQSGKDNGIPVLKTKMKIM